MFKAYVSVGMFIAVEKASDAAAVASEIRHAAEQAIAAHYVHGAPSIAINIEPESDTARREREARQSREAADV